VKSESTATANGESARASVEKRRSRLLEDGLRAMFLPFCVVSCWSVGEVRTRLITGSKLRKEIGNFVASWCLTRPNFLGRAGGRDCDKHSYYSSIDRYGGRRWWNNDVEAQLKRLVAFSSGAIESGLVEWSE
jgi:hypothetical protein